jgi:ribosomal subunit interface protein
MNQPTELHVETSYKDIERTDAIDQRVHEAARKQLGRFAERLTRLEVHISDNNAGKSGPDDKRVLVEARPRSMDPVVADATGDDLYATIDAAAAKMRRLLDRHFDKHDERR